MTRAIRLPVEEPRKVSQAVMDYLSEHEFPATVGLTSLQASSSKDNEKKAWNLVKKGVLEAHIAKYPGTRPSGWWQHASPQPVLVCVGDVEFEQQRKLLAHRRALPRHLGPLSFGIPAMSEYNEAQGVCEFQSQATYLEEHGCLVAGELERIPLDAFKSVRWRANLLDCWSPPDERHRAPKGHRFDDTEFQLARFYLRNPGEFRPDDAGVVNRPGLRLAMKFLKAHPALY